MIKKFDTKQESIFVFVKYYLDHQILEIEHAYAKHEKLYTKP